ncbi:transposase [Candidatus Nomurabacteria bacterium]|nr:transposase [Candidatus Nomurabacteria bacterium]MCB9834862.1 transposase [Candidatus Nomurabacteria bacterium]MCB9834882.1 transposase [Candidatus Nomurabacteria bacterium]
MFPIVSEKYDFVIGVDTHAKKHVATAISNKGVVLDQREFRVLEKEFCKFIDWAKEITKNHLSGNQLLTPSSKLDRSSNKSDQSSNKPDQPNHHPSPQSNPQSSHLLFAIEGTSSYGETLTNLLLSRGLEVVEVKPPKLKSRGARGKTDQIDSELAALSVLRLPVSKLIIPRTGELRKNLRVLLSSRRSMVSQRTMNKNALIALLRGVDLGIDVRRALTLKQYQVIANWRVKKSDRHYDIKSEAKRLATSIIELSNNLDFNRQRLEVITIKLSPELLLEPGIGPVSLAQIICAYSHKGRIKSADAFVMLAGAAPIPASSGNTTRYRLNHYGDRQLNCSLTTIVISRIRTDQRTQEYVAKRTKEGLDIRDIKRSLKRYLARSLFKKLENCVNLA